MEGQKSLKRPSETTSEAAASTSKRARQVGETGLLDLSDDVLLYLLRKLLPNSRDLVSSSSACLRLQRICSDATLWTDVDTSRGRAPMSLRETRRLLHFLTDRYGAILENLCLHKSLFRTTSITLGGDLKRQKETISPSLLAELQRRCPKLASLALEACFVDARKIVNGAFPPTLKRLSLAGSELFNVAEKESYFKGLQETLPNLRELDLSGCGWVSNHSLMSICKCDNLQRLDLKGCRRMGECFVYTALATRFGFRALQWVDLRDTKMSDSEVPCFGRLPEIR